nr:hypothetical protein CFP56_45015 [Quercus suber]
MDLRLLPKLPLNIMHIIANGCMSLETLPIRPEDDFRPCLSFRNCIKLIDNQGYNDMFFTMLRRYIQINVQTETEGPAWRCNITPYEDDLNDSTKDTKIKRSRDDFDGDEAGPSGEATNREVEIQHSKRIWLPNLIERFIPHL